MKKLLVCILFLLPLSLTAQEVAGTWSGKLEVGGQSLRIVFHLTQQADGWQATMDSPDQGAKGIPVDSVAVSPMGVTLTVSPLKITYVGGFMGKDNIIGALTQHGQQLSLMLTRGAVAPLRRPQEPTKPYPYREEEFSFVSRDQALPLQGTLTLPQGDGPFPTLILVSGSGTQNRDLEFKDHKSFLVLADRLTRVGYAVLRFDDRGYGAALEEQQRLQYTTTDHYVLDALGAFDALRKHPAVDSSKIGICGHSEGGAIGVMALAEEPELSYLVSLAGMMVSGAELMVTQNRATMTVQGVPAEVTDSYCRALERLYAKWFDETPEVLTADVDRLVAEVAAGENLPAALVENLKTVAKWVLNPWFYRFVRMNPLEGAAKIGDRPIFALNGTKDIQVDAEENLMRLEALQKPTIITRRFEGLNHMLQPCTTGSVAEYGQIDTTLSEEVMTAIIEWLDTHIK